MSKRVLGMIMVLVMAMMVFVGNTAFAESNQVYISQFTANGGSDIYEGNYFDLQITIKNNTGAAITNVGLSIGASSFQPSDGGRDKFVAASVPDTFLTTVRLIYTGGTDFNIPLTITYTDAVGNQTESDSIYITNAKPTVVSNEDPKKYKPVLVLEALKVPEVKAGDLVTVPLTFTNTSSYEAKNIKIEPILAGTPFTMDQIFNYKTVEKLATGKSATVEFQFSVREGTAGNLYEVPFNITYTNAYKAGFEASEKVNIKVINTDLPARLVVREAVSSTSLVQEEQPFTVTFSVWNMGTLSAKNVMIDLSGNDGFFVLDNMTKHYLFEIKGLQYKEITYSLRPKKDLATGTYPISISMQLDGTAEPETYTMYVSVAGKKEEEKKEEKKDDINIITENIVVPEGTVQVEQPFTTSFAVKNTGTTTAKAVKISVDGGDKILPRSLNVINLAEIQPGESVPVAFSFVATKDSDTRTYAIRAAVTYKNNEETISKEQYMGVSIVNPEKDKEKEKEEEKDTTRNTVPKIIISEYSTDPVMVSAGDTFTLRMKFLNTNKEKAVENMKITLIVNEGSEKTGSVFSPVQSSNTFYIAHLGPGQTSEKEMMMYTIPDAQAKTYVVKASFEYEYAEKEQLKTNTMEDLFGIPVVQPAKLETSDIIVSEPAIVGEPVYLSSEFYNMGKVTLSNLMVKVEGDFDTKESNYFVGNFEMGMSDYYEAPVTPMMPGETKGLVVFTFEDSAGKAHRIEKEFTVNAMEAQPVINPDFPIDPNTGMPFDPGMMDPGMEGMKGPRLPIIPIAIGAGVVVLFVVFMIIRKRRKKRKEMMLDEDI